MLFQHRHLDTGAREEISEHHARRAAADNARSHHEIRSYAGTGRAAAAVRGLTSALLRRGAPYRFGKGVFHPFASPHRMRLSVSCGVSSISRCEAHTPE